MVCLKHRGMDWHFPLSAVLSTYVKKTLNLGWFFWYLNIASWSDLVDISVSHITTSTWEVISTVVKTRFLCLCLDNFKEGLYTLRKVKMIPSDAWPPSASLYSYWTFATQDDLITTSSSPLVLACSIKDWCIVQCIKKDQGSIFPVAQSSQTTTIPYWRFGRVRFCSTTKSFQKFLYDFIHFPCVLITSHPLKTFRIMENNKQLLSEMKS